jgi:MFS-type transporter involved in bile tolerance (Atg22 family)
LVAVLVIATLIDLALAGLMVGVSGFILEGVNNTGPQMPEAVLLVAFVVFCVAAPTLAWIGRRQGWPGGRLAAIAFAPPVVAALVLLAGPLFASS